MFAMYQQIFPLLIFLIGLAAPGPLAFAQQTSPTGTPLHETPQVIIITPSDGQALKGNVGITGSTAIQGFASAQLSFRYSDHPTETWFLIQAGIQPVKDGNLAEWDTSTITDGLYDLRLEVERQAGEPVVYTVNQLRVRNYTPVETNTPTPVTPTSTSLPGDTPVPTVTPTPTDTPVPPTVTALPPNPAQISRQDLGLSLGKGAIFTVGLFALIGIYLSIKNIRKRL
jgi:hypothetical protein